MLADLLPLGNEVYLSLLIYSQDIAGANFYTKLAFFTHIQVDRVLHFSSGIVIFLNFNLIKSWRSMNSYGYNSADCCKESGKCPSPLGDMPLRVSDRLAITPQVCFLYVFIFNFPHYP
jgi:hypothetical protein